MKKIFGKNILLHALVFAVFLLITTIYFYPLLEGKDLIQGDVVNADGMSKELKDYHKATGEYAYWTNSMFGGMPAYQIFSPTPLNIYFYIGQTIQQPLPYYTFAIILMALICFYILLTTLGFSKVLAAIGAFAYAFASYNVIIIEAGHITKAYAIAIMPLVIAGFLQTYRGKYLFGALLTAIGLGMNIAQNHVQITYYIALTLGVFVFVEFIYSIKERTLPKFAKATATIFAAVILAILPNIYDIFYTYDYGKESTRSKSELTNVSSNTTGGLDRDYAFMWSYGKMETFTLLIPNFNGGSSNSELSKKSNLYQALRSNGFPDQECKRYTQSAPTYWGDQPFTSGPVYAGAIICFLFVLGLMIIPGRNKWWLLAAGILGVMMSWGKNFPLLNDFLFNYLPGVNKFRTVSMSLVIPSFTMVLLALMALKAFFEEKLDPQKIQKSMVIALASTAGVALVFLLFGGSVFSFSAASDTQIAGQGGQWFVDAVMADRASMFRMDALRTILFILVAFGAMWLYLKSKLSKTVTISIIAAAIVLDIWLVDTRYLSASDFKSKHSVNNAIQESDVDLSIKQDPDLSYRVFNVAGNPFNDSRTSFYHKSIGGYHGAKLRRYQEIIDNQFSKNMNVKVLNMLNVKYFIAPPQEQGADVQIQRNVAALGNAWFIDTLKVVENADAEMAALRGFEPATTTILNKEFAPMVKGWQTGHDSTSTIKLIEYKPDYLKYQVDAKKVEFAVFSEIYYPKYWNVTIDGQKAEHFRVNYILRAMIVPQGKHVIEFKFVPQAWLTAQKVAMWGSILVALLILLYIGYYVKTNYLKKD
jgi:hypothetical protein